MSLKIKDWSKFQHFKDRRPPWIKLYRELLDDMEFHQLQGDCARLLICLWLIASEDESKQGILPDTKTIAFRARMTESRVSDCIKRLSHWLIQDDIKMISEGHQDDAPETETETEKRQSKISVPEVTDDISFWEEIKKLYTWVNIEQEKAKMQAWLMTPRGKGRVITKRFVVNWLNKLDKPLVTEVKKPRLII